MGYDISTWIEQRTADGAWIRRPGSLLNDRNYDVFGFLGSVRNYGDVEPICEMRGLPTDASDELKARFGVDDPWNDNFGESWLSFRELIDHDYEREVEDCGDGRNTVPRGQGKKKTLREFLGEGFFDDLEKMKSVDNPDDWRIVFWFSN